LVDLYLYYHSGEMLMSFGKKWTGKEKGVEY
jgi:hypothetical protein